MESMSWLSTLKSNIEIHSASVAFDAPLLHSHFKSRERLVSSFPVKAREHNVCKNGCELFGDDDGSDRCDEYGEGKASARKMKYLSLIEQLALLISNDQTLELEKSSEKYEKDQDVLYDSFDGILGETLLRFYNNRKDRLVLYLGLYNDGSQVFKNGNHTMTIFHLIILNLPKTIRTENRPIKHELEILQSKGSKLSGSSMTVNAHILFASGDIPACAKLAGQSVTLGN
ncbi:hypothetical protein RMCBS344292_08172 [Rhizopus microsporus]|nr:hypothetical protein RMCBS344292_08172 [Rhizopus microsporus]